MNDWCRPILCELAHLQDCQEIAQSALKTPSIRLDRPLPSPGHISHLPIQAGYFWIKTGFH